MQLVQIKFTTSGANSVTGGFAPGDLARVPADLAGHLVDEARCAQYAQAPGASAAPTEAAKPATRRRKAANPET